MISMAVCHFELRSFVVAERSSETSINIVLSSCFLIRRIATYCSLQYKMRSYLSYGGFKKEIKTHLVFDCLSKFTFGQGFTQLVNKSYFCLYHTCIKKSIEYIKKQPQMRLFQNDFRGYMTSSHKKECGSTHHISRVVSLLSLCSPEDFVLLASAQWLLRLAGREVS